MLRCEACSLLLEDHSHEIGVYHGDILVVSEPQPLRDTWCSGLVEPWRLLVAFYSYTMCEGVTGLRKEGTCDPVKVLLWGWESAQEVNKCSGKWKEGRGWGDPLGSNGQISA